MKILITGATGFVGRHLVVELFEGGFDDVSVLVRGTSDLSLLSEYPVTFVYGDVTDMQSLQQIREEFDVIFHCAGCVQNCDKVSLWAVNVDGTGNICEFALAKKAQKLIYVSSVAVVSGNSDVPLREDMPYAATNLYGQSKLDGEKKAVEYMHKGLPMVIVRPPMIYGEDEPHMLGFITKLIKYGLFILPVKGESKLHISYVRNVSDFLVECMINEKALGNTYFIADKDVLTAAQVFGFLARGMGKREPRLAGKIFTQLMFKIPGIGRRLRFFAKDRVYSIEKAERELGYVPVYGAEESLIKTGCFYQSC